MTSEMHIQGYLCGYFYKEAAPPDADLSEEERLEEEKRRGRLGYTPALIGAAAAASLPSTALAQYLTRDAPRYEEVLSKVPISPGAPPDIRGGDRSLAQETRPGDIFLTGREPTSFSLRPFSMPALTSGGEFMTGGVMTHAGVRGEVRRNPYHDYDDSGEELPRHQIIDPRDEATDTGEQWMELAEGGFPVDYLEAVGEKYEGDIPLGAGGTPISRVIASLKEVKSKTGLPFAKSLAALKRRWKSGKIGEAFEEAGEDLSLAPLAEEYRTIRRKGRKDPSIKEFLKAVGEQEEHFAKIPEILKGQKHTLEEKKDALTYSPETEDVTLIMRPKFELNDANRKYITEQIDAGLEAPYDLLDPITAGLREVALPRPPQARKPRAARSVVDTVTNYCSSTPGRICHNLGIDIGVSAEEALPPHFMGPEFEPVKMYVPEAESEEEARATVMGWFAKSRKRRIAIGLTAAFVAAGAGYVITRLGQHLWSRFRPEKDEEEAEEEKKEEVKEQ
jgi:hypothetical protein